MSSPITISFDNIFENYEQFKTFTDTLSLYEATDTVSELYNQEFFAYLYMRYKRNSINYETPDDFKMMFGLRYKDLFKKFIMIRKSIEEIYKLTNEDYAILSQVINNQSFNPNTKPADGDYWRPISYISQQSGQRQELGKISAFLNAIQSAPTLQIEALTESFLDLFSWVIPQDITYYFKKGEKNNGYNKIF